MNDQNPLSIKWIIIGLAAIFLFLPKEVLAAVSINITSSPSQARIGEEFTVDVSMAGLGAGASYYIKSRL